MEIVKNKYRCKCKRCWKPIVTYHKVKFGKSNYYHLTCYFKYAESKLEAYKTEVKKLRKYKKHMILENL